MPAVFCNHMVAKTNYDCLQHNPPNMSQVLLVVSSPKLTLHHEGVHMHTHTHACTYALTHTYTGYSHDYHVRFVGLHD